MVPVRHLTKRYRAVTAVDDPSVEVGPARVTGFLGPNGAGQTTALRILPDLAAAAGGAAAISLITWERSDMSSQQSINPGAGPLARAARLGLWALPVWAALLFVSTLTHQPNPKTDLAGWSRYVTTPEFLASHLVASIVGAAIGALGLIALGAVLASRGHPRAGLWVIVTGVVANVVSSAVFGIAAFAQPAIGRDYLAGHTAQARLLVNTVVNGGWTNVTAIPSGLLLAASVVIAGVAVARTGSLPRAAGIGFAFSIVLFSIGALQDNFLETIAGVLMIASTVWIAAAAGRRGALAPAASHPGTRQSKPAAAR